MHQTVIITCNLICAILIASSFHVIDNIVLFLVAGIIPGTNVSLSPATMSISVSVVAAALFARLASKKILRWIEQTKLTRN